MLFQIPDECAMAFTFPQAAPSPLLQQAIAHILESDLDGRVLTRLAAEVYSATSPLSMVPVDALHLSRRPCSTVVQSHLRC
jgi:hypothetical protein